MKKSCKLSSVTVVDKYVSTIFGEDLMSSIEKAMGYDALDMQIGNVVSRLRNLGEVDLVDEIRDVLETHNAQSRPRWLDWPNEDLHGRPLI